MSNRKIAILSVHADPNFGSQLQAYALAVTLKRQGYECEYLRFTTARQQPLLKRLTKTMAKWLLGKIGMYKAEQTEYSYLETKEFAKQKSLFSEFHKNIPVSSKTYTIDSVKESNAEYRKFIIGSDQIWSPNVDDKRKYFYFLKFVSDQQKKVSYAPSIGTTHLAEEYKKVLKNELTKFAFVSCREYANSELLNELLPKHVEYVLDPTLLLDANDWNELSVPISMPPKYILCYILGTKDCISEYAELLGRKQDIPVYYIVTCPHWLNKSNTLKDLSVGQFLSLISEAECVVTDSFHGTMFSINFNTNFYSFTKREAKNTTINDNDRLQDILSVLGLVDRMKDDSDKSFSGDVNFSNVNSIIRQMRQSSLKYLKKIAE